MLEKVDQGHHVLRVYCKGLVARLYENSAPSSAWRFASTGSMISDRTKGSTSARASRDVDGATDRLASFEAKLLNVHVDFPLFQRLALPISVGQLKAPAYWSASAALTRID
jgi:hypothetical protein